MIDQKKIAVVVPAHNEELLISRVIETMPSYVDKIYIVDDASNDRTVEIVEAFLRKENYKDVLTLIKFPKNMGVGAAIVAGYRRASEDGVEVVAVMAGDAQMHPDDLKDLITPVAKGEVDYTKGNRLFFANALHVIPTHRLIGNSFLSLLTKLSSGYWHIADSQTGYTAISKHAIDLLPLEKLYKRYGYPNHILAMMNIYNLRVRDVPVRPIYNIGEKSEIRLWKVIPTLSWLLFINFLWRMREKYIYRDFHPLVFFYSFGFFLAFITVLLAARLIYIWYLTGDIPAINALAIILTTITSFQSLFFGMWFDMEYNRDLR